MDIKPILGAGVGLQATGLAMSMYPSRKKKKKKYNMLGNFATASMGIPLLGAQSEMINKL